MGFFKTKGKNPSGYCLANNEWNGFKIFTAVRVENVGDSSSFFLNISVNVDDRRKSLRLSWLGYYL